MTGRIQVGTGMHITRDQSKSKHGVGRSDHSQGITERDFPGGAVVKNPPANAGDTGSSPSPGRSHMPRSN